MTRQTDSINHVTFQIFSNSSFPKRTQQQKKKRVHLKERDFNVFNTHYCPHSASVHPPSSPICHSQGAYDTAIWEAEIIQGEGRRHSEGGWSWGVKTGGRERTEGGRRIKKKSAGCSSWIHLEYYLILRSLLWSRGSSAVVIYTELYNVLSSSRSVHIESDRQMLHILR